MGEYVKVVYMAHPVGHEPERTENLKRARRWFRWLIDTHPDWAVTAPWLLYCETWDETPEHRRRGMSADLALLRRCDGIVLVGGSISPGMEDELDMAQELGMEVFDLTEQAEPPPPDSEGVAF